MMEPVKSHDPNTGHPQGLQQSDIDILGTEIPRPRVFSDSTDDLLLASDVHAHDDTASQTETDSLHAPTRAPSPHRDAVSGPSSSNPTGCPSSPRAMQLHLQLSEDSASSVPSQESPGPQLADTPSPTEARTVAKDSKSLEPKVYPSEIEMDDLQLSSTGTWTTKSTWRSEKNKQQQHQHAAGNRQPKLNYKPVVLRLPYQALLLFIIAGFFAFLEYEIHSLPQPYVQFVPFSPGVIHENSNFGLLDIQQPETTASPASRHRGLSTAHLAPTSTTTGVGGWTASRTTSAPLNTAMLMARGKLTANPEPIPPSSVYPTPGVSITKYFGWGPPAWYAAPRYDLSNDENVTWSFYQWIPFFTTKSEVPLSWCPCNVDLQVSLESGDLWIFRPSPGIALSGDASCQAIMNTLINFYRIMHQVSVFDTDDVPDYMRTMRNRAAALTWTTTPPAPVSIPWSYPITTNNEGAMVIALEVKTSTTLAYDVFGTAVTKGFPWTGFITASDGDHTRSTPFGHHYKLDVVNKGISGPNHNRVFLVLRGSLDRIVNHLIADTKIKRFGSLQFKQPNSANHRYAFAVLGLCNWNFTRSLNRRVNDCFWSAIDSAPVSQLQQFNNFQCSSGQPTYPEGPVSPNDHFFNLQTEADYLLASLVPVLLATLLSIPIQVFTSSINHMLPFKALRYPTGATAEDSLSLPRGSLLAPIISLRFLHRFKDPLPILNVLLGLLSTLLVPLSSETVRLEYLPFECHPDHVDGQVMTAKPCPVGLRVSGVPTRAAEALLAVIAAVIALMAYLLWRWRSGLATEPWSIAAMASMLSSSGSELKALMASMPPCADGVCLRSGEVEKTLKGRRFRLGGPETRHGEPTDNKGQAGHGDDGGGAGHYYGIHTIRLPEAEEDAGEVRLTAQDPPRRRTSSMLKPRTSPASPFDMEFFGRIVFLVFIGGLLILILYYENSMLNTKFETFMDSQTFGVRILFTGMGSIVSIFWDFQFSRIAENQLYHRLTKRPQPAPRSILLSPPSSVFTGLYSALATKDLVSANVSLATLLAKFTPILLSNIPFRNTVTWKTHEACTWLAVAVLSYMFIVLFASLWVRRAYMPVAPSSIAACMYYVCDSAMLKDFEGLVAVGRKERDRLVGGGGDIMGLGVGGRRYRYIFGEIVGVKSGERRIAVDYHRLEQRAAGWKPGRF
ncbi:hypothetical protein B0T19DRAFT_402103 [Cercophora scortea]|uniref:Uncharacterized protein n=1 Tax=Cercophora scortea TaxID=314031 RepID=A0AAE0IF80_9PEZI|nr:hypothetical protein B0T19DRAFT_402103 [Cercophora scortea]